MKPNNLRKAKPDTPEYAQMRQRIVEAAINVLAECGLAKFRFDALADAMGCNRATIYRYFDSKQELIEAVMLALMHQITADIIAGIPADEKATRHSVAESLHAIIVRLQREPRYAVVMEAQQLKQFAQLSREHFSDITREMLNKFMLRAPSGQILKQEVAVDDAVQWLMHQLISYAFFGIPGASPEQEKMYLEKMVIPVII